jgi:hypothetical protein
MDIKSINSIYSNIYLYQGCLAEVSGPSNRISQISGYPKKFAISGDNNSLSLMNIEGLGDQIIKFEGDYISIRDSNIGSHLYPCSSTIYIGDSGSENRAYMLDGLKLFLMNKEPLISCKNSIIKNVSLFGLDIEKIECKDNILESVYLFSKELVKKLY